MRRPDDMHVHLRDGQMLGGTVLASAKHFARALVMPNTVPPITTVASANEYRSKIIKISPNFSPLMTLYLTDTLQVEDLTGITAVKWYPAGATTNSEFGVRSIDPLLPKLEKIAAAGVVLAVHGEVTNPEVDIFDREARFLETLKHVRNAVPELKIVLEHVTTRAGVEFVHSESNMAATITPQHLLINRNDLLVGGIKPHNYCLPIAKREEDRLALVQAATSGANKFFLGTDSAPHAKDKKESACGCAGCFTSPWALSLYAKVFDEAGCLDRLENFASVFGPQFYGLDLSEERIELVKKEFTVPESCELGGITVVPFWAGKTLEWQVA